MKLWAVIVGALLAVAALTSLPSAAYAQAAYTSGYRWDAMRRLVGTISADPDGTGALPFIAVRYSYDADGQLIKTEKGTLSAWQADTVLPVNWPGFVVYETTLISYDAAGNKIEERALKNDGSTVKSVIQTSYDEDDRPYCVTTRMNLAAIPALPTSYSKTFACSLGTAGSFGADRVTRNVYDAAGQLAQVKKAVATTSPALEQGYATYSYTANGKQQYVIDANGNRAQYAYDGYDRQTYWYFPSTTRPIAFDPTTQATALATAGAVNASDYEQYTLDANGNRTGLRKRDGSIITYGYDALNRMTSKDWPGTAGDVSYSYDLLGHNLTAIFTASGKGITDTWDNAGRKLTSTTTMGTASRQLKYQYDADGGRIRLTWPDGQYATFDHDQLERLTAVYEGGATALAQLAYYAHGALNVVSRASGATTTYSYGTDMRPSSFVHNLTGTAGDVTYGFPQYNPAGQITQRTRDNNSYAFAGSYNVNRNYTANGLNQYSAAGPATFCYDANGNLTSDGTTVYQYSVENQLIQANAATSTGCPTYPGMMTATLGYDPLGRLYQTTNGASVATQLLYDGDELVAEYDGAGSLLRRYVHGASDDDPLVWYEGPTMSASSRQFLHADWQGSIVAISDNAGSPAAVNAYDDYGIPNAGNQGRFQYTGQAWIPELGMYYYKARIYSPTLGRFMQTDPIGYKDQNNLYSYIGNDPIDGRDPSGLAGDWLSDAKDFVHKWVVEPAVSGAERVPADLRDAYNHIREGDIGYVLDGLPPTASGGANVAQAGFRATTGIVEYVSSLVGPSSAGLIKAGFSETAIAGKTFMSKDYNVGGQVISFAGSYSKSGTRAVFGDLQIFGSRANELGGKAVLQLKNMISADLKAAGFKEFRVMGTRISGANAGRDVDTIVKIAR